MARLLAGGGRTHLSIVPGESEVSPSSKIGVGRGFRLPLPPNRTGGSPASGSPVGELPSGGLDCELASCRHGEQPEFVEVGVGPFPVGEAVAVAFAFMAFA